MATRETILQLSDTLGIARRPITESGGEGNRRWNKEELDLLATACELQRHHGVTIDLLREVRTGNADPALLASWYEARLRRIALQPETRSAPVA